MDNTSLEGAAVAAGMEHMHAAGRSEWDSTDYARAASVLAAVSDPDQQHTLYDCGICGSLHPWGFTGDCRDDSNRYSDAEDYAERAGVHILQVHEMDWESRQRADLGDL